MIIGGLVVVGGIAVVVILFSLTRVPHVIPKEKMTFSYIENLESVGGLDILGTDEDNTFAVFTNDDDAESNGVLVRAVISNSILVQVVDTYADKDCTISLSSTATNNGQTYYKGSCDDSAYYGFLDATDEDTRGILFETVDLGSDALDSFIESYLAL